MAHRNAKRLSRRLCQLLLVLMTLWSLGGPAPRTARAVGGQAKANEEGCFVWADATSAELWCTSVNLWLARASGGVYFQTSGNGTSGVYVAAGGNSWNGISNRATKENFSPADGRAILEKLASLRVQEYNLES